MNVARSAHARQARFAGDVLRAAARGDASVAPIRAMRFDFAHWRAFDGYTSSRMPRFIETLGGLCCLLMLAARSGFRLRSSAYWRWRDETAFGRDPAKRPPIAQRVHAMLDYGRWVWRMKRRM